MQNVIVSFFLSIFLFIFVDVCVCISAVCSVDTQVRELHLVDGDGLMLSVSR